MPASCVSRRGRLSCAEPYAVGGTIFQVIRPVLRDFDGEGFAERHDALAHASRSTSKDLTDA